MQIVKKIVLTLALISSAFAEDIVVFNNEYSVIELQKRVKKLIVGNKEMINVSVLEYSQKNGTLLKVFGKKSGNSSILAIYKDGSIENFHVYVNENLGFVQKMINIIEPSLKLSKVGDGSAVITGRFQNPHDKKRIFELLESADINVSRVMDLTETKTVDKMIRTKLYLVEINNQKAKDLGGVTGLGFFSEYVSANINPTAKNGATFSGWLLDNAGDFSATTGNSVAGTLNFLESEGIGTILDDTVLITTEDKNASFRVGGEVFIPKRLMQTVAGLPPMIQVEERNYGLDFHLNSKFMEIDGFLHMNINIKDSAFDPDTSRNVKLGEGVEIPSFVSKNIQTNVVAKSGQVIVLGGRLHSEDLDQEEKIPLLGDIPLLGKLFTRSVKNVKNNDLLFFLVPEIVDANVEVDETRFYEEFKESSEQFHRDILDANATKKTPNAAPLVKKADIEQSDDSLVVIELEEQNSQIDTFVDESETPHSAVEEPEELEMSEIEQKNRLYAVMSEKIFLRDAPLTGKRTNVWSGGHRFRAAEEKEVNGSVWLKVSEDCLENCQKVAEELWISRKYVRAE